MRYIDRYQSAPHCWPAVWCTALPEGLQGSHRVADGPARAMTRISCRSEVLMSEVTQILHAIAQGDPQAASQLLPLVYQELRQLAAHKLAGETPGQTLQPTALVHEAYLRLVGIDEPEQGDDANWDN